MNLKEGNVKAFVKANENRQGKEDNFPLIGEASATANMP